MLVSWDTQYIVSSNVAQNHHRLIDHPFLVGPHFSDTKQKKPYGWEMAIAGNRREPAMTLEEARHFGTSLTPDWCIRALEQRP